jgi:DNA-binding MarR family transcriptional regulator
MLGGEHLPSRTFDSALRPSIRHRLTIKPFLFYRRTMSAVEEGTGDHELAQLERHLIGFVRAFGLLQGDTTPCGEPIPVSEAHAITELAASGPISQRELGERLQLTKGTVSRIARLLAERGWIRPVRSARDARVVELRLTSAGRAAARRLAARRRQKLAAVLDVLPGADRQQVIDALALLTKAAHAPA